MGMRKMALGAALAAGLSVSGAASAAVYINEFHYDNTGGDSGEFIEVVTTASEDASLLTVSLYNGSDGELYGSNDTFVVGSDFTDHGIKGDGNRYYSLSLPSNGLQNGSPDGLAIDLDGTVIEFLSYEGEISNAGDGPAAGLDSTDIGASESSSAAVGSSLQRLSFGSSWVFTDGSNTQGDVNVPEPASLALLGLGGIAMLSGRRRKASA